MIIYLFILFVHLPIAHQYIYLTIQVWDLGGQTSIRPYWRCYYANTDAVIYVIDSCDRDRISTSKEELMAMLSEEELKTASLLVFANKQDMPGAMSVSEVGDCLLWFGLCKHFPFPSACTGLLTV